MQIKPRELWLYVNKGLVLLLGSLFLATLGSVAYLAYVLLNVSALINQSGSAVSAVIVSQDLLINLQDAETSQH